MVCSGGLQHKHAACIKLKIHHERSVVLSVTCLLSGCNYSPRTGGQRKDLPVDQRALRPGDPGERAAGAQQEEGVRPGPGSDAVALLWDHRGPAAGEAGREEILISNPIKTLKCRCNIKN